MNGRVKTSLLEAIRIMMKPLVRLLINQGVSHADFSEALKDVYVDSAIRHFREGQRINQSRIAIITGLTRKEVRNIITRALESGGEKKVHSRPERVLAGWHNDPEYIGPYGVTLELPYEGVPGAASFVELVKVYSGDMSPRAMLEELKRGGSVTEIDGVIKVVRRDFEPGALTEELIVRLGEVGHKFFSTAAANIEKKEQGSGYFDRFVYAEKGCTPNVIAEFDEFVKEYGHEFLVTLDTWLATKDSSNDPKQERKETGVYVVQYVETPEEKTNLTELLVSLDYTAND